MILSPSPTVPQPGLPPRRTVPTATTAAAALAVVLVAAPAPAQVSGPGGNDGARKSVQERLRSRLEPLALDPGRIPDGGLRAAGARLPATPWVVRLYADRSFRPAWTDGGEILPRARAVTEALEGAASHGLSPDDYHLETRRSLLRSRGGRGPGPDSLVALELVLTDAYLRYASHLLGGRLDPAAVDPNWSGLRREERDPVKVLSAALEAGRPASALAALAPGERGYDALRQALSRYRQEAAAGGWPPVPGGPALRRDDRDPRVAALRRRLAASGDLPEEAADSTPEPELFDRELETGVRSFQRRHGLDPDGVVGERTLAALNISAAERARRIEVNLERWRWLSRDLGRRHVFVNIADFSAELVEADSTVLESRVVVGRSYRQTPVFSDTMRYLVLNPSWNVPHSIATRDLLPQIREDPAYLDRQGIAVYRGWEAGAEPVDAAAVDWSSVSRGDFPYRLVQRPGPLNALGRVKFMFPNRFSVYLHDTPAQGLYARSVRSFSSGCVRVEKAMELAERLLGGPDSAWTADALRAAVEDGRERTVSLPEPVPVHIQYWTAWADPDGTVHFREDVYGRDRKLMEALARASSPDR